MVDADTERLFPGLKGLVSRTLFSVAAGVIALAGVPLSPAEADPTGPPEAMTSSVVTRLTLDEDGVGWLTVQPRFYSTQYRGFDVFIPAGAGAWSGPAQVAVPELGTDCVRDAGPDLHYRCGQSRAADRPEQMPVGGYAVSFKVRHTGSTVGLQGTSSVYAISDFVDDWTQEYIVARNPDIFPVYRSPHFRSTAEVRMVPVDGSVQSEVTTSVTVVPGETVTALDLDLGRLQWRGTGSNAGRHGIQCFVRRVAVPSLHCKPAPGHHAFPIGRFQLVIDLAYSRSTPQSPYFTQRKQSTVAMTVDGAPSAQVDDFYWSRRELY